MDFFGSTQSCAYFRPAPPVGRVLPNLSTMKDSYKCFARPQPVYHHLNLDWKPKTRYKISFGEQNDADGPSGDDTKMPPLAPSNAAPTTPEEWRRANTAHLRQSEASRRQAEKMRAETSRLIQVQDQLTRKAQSETSRRIGERMTDIAFWTNELSYEVEQLVRDSEMLKGVKTRLEKALSVTEGPKQRDFHFPLQMAKECLYHRQKKLGNELITDTVEKELVQEVSVIASCQEQIQRLIDKTMKQLETNRKVQHVMEKDIDDKHAAYHIEDRCHKLMDFTSGIAFFMDVDRMDVSASVPESWAKFSENSILLSQSERAATAKVRDEVERVVEVTSREMWSQYHRVNIAFASCISETAEAKDKLQAHLAKTLQEVFQTERTISALEEAIRNKEAPLKVAQTRLKERSKRPNIELCKDPPHSKLLTEIHSINGTVASLKLHLAEARDSLQQLVNSKATLEQELFAKAHSLFIDREKCMGIRKIFPSSPRLAGYT
nr:PREDICTED: tektin-5 isoform X1 [Lepisosteus oculatus]